MLSQSSHFRMPGAAHPATGDRVIKVGADWVSERTTFFPPQVLMVNASLVPDLRRTEPARKGAISR